jgi:class 3 adenylate cyclase
MRVGTRSAGFRPADDRVVRDDLPTGTVTFLFTDVEGSTKLLHELGAEAYAQALVAHGQVIREACARHDGVEVDTQGEAFFMAFATAPEAVAAAAELTDTLDSGLVRVRVGLHTGTPLLAGEGYVGIDVHRAARIAASGLGGQVLVSRAADEELGRRLVQQGLDGQLALEAQVQRCAGGGEHDDLAHEELRDDPGDSLQMLEVVEHEQHPPRGEPAGDVVVGLQPHRLSDGGRTAWVSRRGASAAKNVPSRNSSESSAAACSASRVFPDPPGPVRVRSRTPSATRVRISASSRSRPRSGHAATGRFVLPSDRIGGKSRPPSW